MENDLPATTPTKKISDPLAGDCKCVEGSKKTSSQEYDDRKVQAGMEFENALQNFIFVPNIRKSKNGSSDKSDGAEGAALDSNAIPNGGATNPSRRRRDVALEPELDDVEGSVLLRHVRSITDDTDAFFEKDDENTYKDEEDLSSNKQFYEVFAKELPPNQTYFVFEKLRHFTRYAIFVVACREEIPSEKLRDISFKKSLCSDYGTVFQTTKRKSRWT